MADSSPPPAASAGSPPAPAVLFICHHTGRTGAPLGLFSLVRWLKANTRLRLHVLLRYTGELQRDFESVADVFVVPRLPRIAAALLRRTAGQAAIAQIEDRMLRRRARRLKVDLIYSNTITNTREIKALAPLGVPILCHVHELGFWIRHELGLQQALDTLPLTRRFIAAANCAQEFLVTGLGVSPETIDVIREFPFRSGQPRSAADSRPAMRQKLGIDDQIFLVGACGTVDWRKGSDLFLAIAQAVAQRPGGQLFRFIWLGGPVSGPFFRQLQHDVARAGLSEVVSFSGPSASPEGFYAACDAFLLPSREDCCPLVMLEAAAARLPILCFEQSGGAPEFVADGAGISVPYLDVRRMATTLLALARSPVWRESLGTAAAQRVELRHNGETQCRAIFAAMARTQPRLDAATVPT
jgi:glycosyltransferase involved in cell wall biosynthesis